MKKRMTDLKCLLLGVQLNKEKEGYLNSKFRQTTIDRALRDPQDSTKMLRAIMAVEDRRPVFKDSMKLTTVSHVSFTEGEMAFVFCIETTTTCDLPGLRDKHSTDILRLLAPRDYIQAVKSHWFEIKSSPYICVVTYNNATNTANFRCPELKDVNAFAE